MSGRFRWVHFQLEYLADCPLIGIQRALGKLPATSDKTYERTLREIKDTNSKYVATPSTRRSRLPPTPS